MFGLCCNRRIHLTALPKGSKRSLERDLEERKTALDRGRQDQVAAASSDREAGAFQDLRGGQPVANTVLRLAGTAVCQRQRGVGVQTRFRAQQRTRKASRNWKVATACTVRRCRQNATGNHKPEFRQGTTRCQGPGLIPSCPYQQASRTLRLGFKQGVPTKRREPCFCLTGSPAFV
jgi:hypothetical protein